MSVFAKLTGLALGLVILVALWLSATRIPVPLDSAVPPNHSEATFTFPGDDLQLASGLALGAMGNFELARTLLSRFRNSNPSSPMGYSPVAGTYLAEGQLIEALFWMREAQSVDPRDLDLAGWMILIYDALEDYETASLWSDWLGNRVTNQPLPMAMLASHHYVSGYFELALQYSNLAIKFSLPDRWGSDAVFMRIKRDEALASGKPESGIRVFEQQHPGLFLAKPVITAANICQATDLALLLKMAGRQAEFLQLLESVTQAYERQLILGGTFRPDIVPVLSEALAIQGENLAALAELRRIIDQGWRIPWRWKTDLNPNFDGLRQTAEFQAMVAELEADVDWQRSRVQAISVPGPTEPPTLQEEIQQVLRPLRE